MNITAIEWTNFTSNPLKYRDAYGNIVWGCIHASPGCMKCYAEQLAKRYGRGGDFNVQTMSGLTPFLAEKELRHILTAKTIKGQTVSGKKCFIGDMTDLFGPWVPEELLFHLWSTMARRKDVIFQVLTKRPARALELITKWIKAGVTWREGVTGIPVPNIWVGVSVENQQYANERIPLLLQTPAAVRFVSYEPALGPVYFHAIGVPENCDRRDGPWILYWNALTGFRASSPYSGTDGNPKLDWIICGGESGPDARPMNPKWARSVRDKCQKAGTAFFFKQWGQYLPSDQVGALVAPGKHAIGISKTVVDIGDGLTAAKMNKHFAGAFLDGREWREFPR